MFCISKKWFSELIEIPCISNYREAEKETDESVAGDRHGPARHPRLPPVSVRGPRTRQTHRPRLGEQMHTDKHFRYEDKPHTLHLNAWLFRAWLKYSLSVYNNLCACLLQQPDSSAERIKELAEVSYFPFIAPLVLSLHCLFHITLLIICCMYELYQLGE